MSILNNRNISIEDYKTLNQYQPYNSKLFKDFIKFIDRLIKSLDNYDKIMLYGDYDADGITSTSLLYNFIRIYYFIVHKNTTFNNIEAKFPVRTVDKYGLSEKAVEYARSKSVKLIVTLDNGITSIDPIIKANSYNIDTIIIDHHTMPDDSPPAFAIINPKQSDCKYPFKDFCTVGLVYKVIEYISNKFFDNDIAKKIQYNATILTGIGTYQDMVSMLGENRYFVINSLNILKNIYNNNHDTKLLGLNHLIKMYTWSNSFSYEIIGFFIGPIINSTGRISDPILAFNLLTTIDKSLAYSISNKIYSLNSTRKSMTYDSFIMGKNIVEENKLYLNEVIFIHTNAIHEGIIGIVAQRLTSFYNKSTVVVSNHSNDYYTGSCRASIGVDIGGCIISLKDLCMNCGGHKKAAGFSLSSENLDKFREELLYSISSFKYEEKISIDYTITLDKVFSKKMFNTLQSIEPFGTDFSEPIVSVNNLKVLSIKKSKRGLDTILYVEFNGMKKNLIIFEDISMIDKVKPYMLINTTGYLSIDKRDILYRIVDINIVN